MSDWHLDKRLNIGHVLSTLIIAATAFSYINSIESKTDANTLQIETIKDQRKEDNTRIEKQRKEDVERVEKQLSNINAKLDKLLSK
jgi:hypothetical protein